MIKQQTRNWSEIFILVS